MTEPGFDPVTPCTWFISAGLPDGVSSATAVDLAIFVQDDVGLQVPVIVVRGVVVGYDP